MCLQCISLSYTLFSLGARVRVCILSITPMDRSDIWL